MQGDSVLSMDQASGWLNKAETEASGKKVTFGRTEDGKRYLQFNHIYIASKIKSGARKICNC